MAKSKRKVSRRRARGRASRVLDQPTDRKLTLDLLKELHHVILDAAADIGVSEAEQRRALKLAAQDSSRRRPSERIMNVNFRIATLLNCWRYHKRYQRPDGTPRVLPIHGTGATFQALARAFVPQMSLDELVEKVCKNAEVTRLGKKIALIGSPVMMTPKTAEITLASLAVRLRRLTQTIVHNAALPLKVNPSGRFERIVTGEFTEKEFREFSQRVRQPMQDFCDQIDAGIRQPRRGQLTGRKVRPGGVGLYVFRDDGEIG